MIIHQNTLSKILSRTFGTKFFFILSFGTIISFSSCDESSVVGLDVQPSNDLLNIGFQDTTTLTTKTMKLDSIRTDEDFQTSSMAMLGKYLDPVFGKTTSSIYTQLGLSANISGNSFGTNPICDSVILALIYDSTSVGTYGEKRREKQKLNVYRLTENIVRGSTYYSNNTLNYDATDDLANGFVFTPKPKTMVTIITSETVVAKPQLRVPLGATLFGQLLLNNQATGFLANNTAFQSNLLKGLYITTENTLGLSKGEGNIMRFKLDESKMILYYHNDDTTKQHFEFNLSSVAHFVHFDHDYSYGINVSLSKQLMNDFSDASVTFVQAMGGVKTKILTPYLLNWIDSGAIAINKAELIVKAADGKLPNTFGPKTYSPPFNTSLYQLDTFSAPITLVIGGINDDGTGYSLPDATEGSSYFGGNYNSSTQEYRFNIARYIQQVLDGQRHNNGLYLVVPPLVANAYAPRVVLGGSAPGPYQMKLNITYTKLH